MNNLNEHITRMVSLIDAKHGHIKPALKEDEDKELQKKKEEDEKKQKELQKKKDDSEKKKKDLEQKKERPEITDIDFTSELDKICDDYDYQKAEDLEDFMEDNFTIEEQKILKNKILNLIKSCQI